MFKNYLLLLCACLPMVSCSSIQHTTQLSQPVDIKLTVGIGDLVISLSKEKNLPNAFGKADILGRKTLTGMTTVQYLGVRNNKAIFKRKSVVIETGATTMNSTPLIIPNSSTTTYSGRISGTRYSGTSSGMIGGTVYSGSSSGRIGETTYSAVHPPVLPRLPLFLPALPRHKL